MSTAEGEDSLLDFLKQHKLESLYEKLKEAGVEEPEDLRHLHQEDLKEAKIPVVKRRKLLEVVRLVTQQNAQVLMLKNIPC